MQNDRALLGAAQGLRAHLHGQGGFAPQFQPRLQIFSLRRYFLVQGANATAVAVAAHYYARHLEVEHCKFNGG